MIIKVNRTFYMKIIALTLCLFIGILPFFQPKKANASAALVITALTAGFITGMAAVGYTHYASLTPEQMNEMNEKATANLKEAYPNATDYDNQVNIIYNLEKDLLEGKDIDWSKYSGKALYAVLKGVVDVVWPTTMTEDQLAALPNYYIFMGYTGNVAVFISYEASQFNGFPVFTLIDTTADRHYYNMSNLTPKSTSINVYAYNISSNRWYNPYGGTNSSPSIYSTPSAGYTAPYGNRTLFLNKDNYLDMVLSGQNIQKIPNITAKTANKVKLPTRLPQSVINNITNYIDGSTENLIINPTPDELPQLPDNYDPTTDELPDLPGYADVTPDQEPTDEPTPTPTPPDPTPTPPEYDGSGWVNPIGNFLAGLLEFLKTAFVPTQSLDFSPLQNMESGTFGAKFPFSLPSDFGKILGVIQADPITPKFDASIPLSKVRYQDIPMEIDLEPYSNIAGICKSGFVILFCIGLFFLTRRFMSPGG